MSVFESARGRRLDITLPPPGSLEGLDAVAQAYERLKRERKVTATRLGGLRGERERVVDQERAALARALKDGKEVPKTSKVEKIDRDISAAEQRLAALEEALDLASEELIVVADECCEEWTEQVLGEVSTAQREYQEAVEVLASASGEVLAKIALLRWARLFPEDEISYRVRGSNVLALRAPHGDPYSLDEVLQALREDAQVTYDPRAWVSRDPLGARIQVEFEEKRANEEKGLGFLTDAQIAEGITEELVRETL